MPLSDRRCPRCRTQMHVARAPDLTLHGCADCGGVWTDNAASQWIAGGNVSDQALELARRVAKFAATRGRQPAYQSPPKHARGPGAYRSPAPPPEARRLCPTCSAFLQPAYVAAVTLDICAAHGTWFDPGELASVHAHYAGKRARDEAEMERFLEELKEPDPSHPSFGWGPTI